MARALKPPKLKNLPVKLPSRLPKLPDPSEPDVFEEMTLLEHMEELRDRIIKSAIAIGIAFIAGIALAYPMLERLKYAAAAQGGFDVVSPTDPITIYFKIALYIAVGISLPVLIWQFIGFLAPGLTKKEKRLLFMSLPFVVILFLVGVAYAFFFAAPRALGFLSTVFTNLFDWSPEGGEVINFFLTLMIGLGLAFQLPIIMFVLAKLGVVSPTKMRAWRKYAFLVILVLAAVITPSTDPINMAVVFIPLYVLYEAGILVSRMFARTTVEGVATS